MHRKKGKIIIAAVIILLILIGFSFYYISHHQNTENKSDSASKEQSIQLKDYQAYYPDNVDFGYILAEVEVKSDADISLDHFTTSENISLADTRQYKALLDSQNDDTSSIDIKPLSNGSNTLFIPIQDKSLRKLDVSSDIDSLETMHFTLDSKEETSPQAESETSPEPSASSQANDKATAEQGGNKVTISRIFEVDPAACMQNGSEAMLPSSARVYAAEIEVKALTDSSLKIESAEYDTTEGETFYAEDSSFADQEYTSAIGTELHTGDKACVYFILLGNGDEELSYNGTLRLKKAGSNDVLSAQTSLS